MASNFVSGLLPWCAAANDAILLLAFEIYLLRLDWMHRLHARWFDLSAPLIDGIVYAFLAPTNWRYGFY